MSDNSQQKNKKRGVLGDAIYPVRIIGYVLACTSVILTQLYVEQKVSILAFVFMGLMLIYPHIAFWYYKKNKSIRQIEFQTLLVDMFWIGWISNFVYWMPAVFLPYFIANSATNYAVNGISACSKGILIYIFASILGFFVNQTVYMPIHIPDIYLLPSFVYLFAGSHYVGLLSHWRGSILRKTKEEIQNQNLELKAQKDQLLVLNEEYNQQNQEILAQRDNIEQQRIILEQRNQIIEKINTDMKDSLNYAQIIQQTILPLPEQLNHFFKEHFILFQPRDIVSGDFYFFENIDDQFSILAVADCTGHGIPGAFMSLIANQILQEIINKKIYSPAEILQNLHIGIRQALKQKETTNRDGMDISICLINKIMKTIEFAGAKTSLIYFENNEIQVIKSENMSIGGEQRETQRIFNNHFVTLKNNCDYRFYLFTDGFHDQFGGEKSKKFGKKRLRETLIEAQNLPLSAQKNFLENILTDWIEEGNEEQIDDILIFGFSV